MPDGTIQIRVEQQQNPVADEVSAITAVVRPILEGTLWALKGEVVRAVGGHAEISLALLARLYRPGDGDVGLCFEWAIHDAMNRRDPLVLERLDDALRNHCRVPGNQSASILFGAEKTGALKLIDTAHGRLTDDSRVLVGHVGQPPKLKSRINMLAAAFRRPDVRVWLPYSISGLWKADLFLGHTDTDRWIGTSVKINQRDLEAARGLRLGIVPCAQGAGDRIYRDELKNMVVCPIPYDGAFMEVFFKGWEVVRAFIAADARVPHEVDLPRPAARQVARYLADRREFSVLRVLNALVPLSQPGLLDTTLRDAESVASVPDASVVTAVVAPKAQPTN
jgi:hypothetical protein